MNGVDRALQKTKAYLDSWGLVYEEPLERTFLVPYGSASVFISAIDLGDDQSVITMRAHLVFDVPLSAALYRHIAFNQPAFGRLALWTDDETGETNIHYIYDLLADYLDEPEFKFALSMVATNADALDDQLVDTFGGVLSGDA